MGLSQGNATLEIQATALGELGLGEGGRAEVIGTVPVVVVVVV